MTFLRLRSVEGFFFHKCCDTTIANLLVNMKGNLLLFSGTWRSLALKIAWINQDNAILLACLLPELEVGQ